MQEIKIIGRVGNNAEIKDLGTNQVIEFSVAVSETFTRNNEKVTETTWFKCAKWGNNTSIAQYILKGGQVYVSGKPKNRAYIKSDGTAEVSNEITVFEIELLGDKPQQ